MTDSPEATACHKCGAAAGEPCKTPSGNRASEAHLPRRRAYHRRWVGRGVQPAGDSPIVRLAQAEADARDQLDRS